MVRTQGMRAIFALFVILLAATTAVGQGRGVHLPVDEDDVLILEVRAERYLASSGLIGYRHGDQVLLPLGELADVLEYAIISYPRHGTVEGWLVDEDRTFALDVNNRSVTIEGRQTGVPDGSLYVNEDDVYVTSDVLEEWWPIDLDIDLVGLRVTVVPRETVPLIARLNRESRWSQMSPETGLDPEYPRNEAEYRMAAWPFLDATVSLEGREDRGPTWRGSVLSRGDLAKLSVTGFLGFDNRATNQWRGWLRAGRVDRDAELLGPLSSTEFTLGDVVSTPLPLLDGATRGRGVAVSNRPLGSVSQFDAVDITGDAPPGWEVELYLDGGLYDLQTANPSGHYFFQQVPLHLGLNTIRAVLYGPNGQTRENVHTYNIRSGMWRKGHLTYNYSGMQLGESILGLPITSANVPGVGEWDHRLELGYGLGHTTTLGGSVSQHFVEDGLRQYAEGRLLQSVGPMFLQGVGVKDLEEGWAASVSGQTLIGRESVYLGWSEFSDFQSNTNEGYGDLERRIEARWSGALRNQGRNVLGYRFKWRHEDAPVEYNQHRDFWDFYLSTSLGRVSISHNARYLHETGDLSREELLGQLRLAGYLAGLRVSGDMEYDIIGNEGVRTLGMVVSNRFSDRITSQLTARRNLLGTGSTFIQAQLDWHLRPVRLGLRGGHDSVNGNFVGVSATTSLVKSPESSGWVMSNRPLTNYGAALVQAFIDLDNDGVFGSGDENLAGVGFSRNPLWQDIRTADDGQAFLPGLVANQFVNVKVDPGTIEDPYLVPAFSGMTTVVHPGGIAKLAFPFRYVGEIEGVVARDESLARPMRNIGLELLDLDGNRVATTVSEFDGFYLFQNVLPGDYFVGVVENTLRGKHYIVPEPQPVSVPAGGDYVKGPAIILRGALDEPPAVVAKVLEVEPEAPAAVEEEPMVAVAGDPVAEAGAGSGSGTSGGTSAPIRGAEGTDEVAATGPAKDPAGGRADDAGAGATGVIADAGSGAADTAIDTPVVAAAETQPDNSSDVAELEPETAATSKAPTKAPVTPAAMPQPVEPAATVADVVEGPAPDTVRAMHLIYELLNDSSLFSSDSR